MNNLNKYVDYLQPLVKTFKENYNQFYCLEYYNLSAGSLTVEDGLLWITRPIKRVLVLRLLNK